MGQQHASPPGNLLFPSMSVPKPAGPFASWPEGQKDDAIKGVRSRCSFLTGMVLDNYQSPKGAILHVIQAMMAACVSKEMPSDWPGQSDCILNWITRTKLQE